MLVPGIFSRPVYPGLRADRYARVNLIAAQGEGAGAVLDLARDPEATAAFFARAVILYCHDEPTDSDRLADLAALKPRALWPLPSLDTAMVRLRGILQTATMGTRIYAAGTEPFVGSVIREAAAFGVDPQSIFTEHRGSARRRVQCVHCKGMTENVTASPVVCSHCGLNLFVRDHYSNRLGAFQGVCIDAENPGEAPAPEELYR